ncbi:RHS repeat domain-containing protein [Pseudocnuella soli]|uniref:RHS repeat domain-containing protein n=1 Tax=Pseudocnuella soli TaxID=2502779 RepID=UPI00104294A0|nr:RHS repeat domain-containing protein [Pseudocnuella soli]
MRYKLASSVKRRLYLLFAACFICSAMGAQIKAPQITPLSPNAAALFKYSEFPVNLYTGVPSISIPLYEIKSGGLIVPVSLSYHAGGFRYEEQASWTGLGWTVQAGGIITRNIRGLADEKLEGLFNKPGQMNLNLQQCDVETFQNILNRYTDFQPDEFSYSIPGRSGRFLYQQGAAQPTTIPYDPLKITKTNTSNSLSKFEVRDEAGTTYQFGNTESTFGGTGAYTEESTPYPTAWLLDKIESADQTKSVIFNYVTGENDVQKHSRQHRIEVIDDVGASGTGCSSPIATIGSPIETSLSYRTNTKYLSNIFFENGKIEFVQSSTYRTDIFEKQRSLEYIKIYSLHGTVYTLVKTIKFVYSYFTKAKSGLLQDWKLKLDKVQVMGSNGVVVEEYSFAYHTNSFSGDSNIDFYAQDYWGYYNGATNNTNLIPRQAIYFTQAGTATTQYIGGAFNRNTDPAYMKEGVLKRITYPTKGYTEFDFETHQYEEGQIKYAGGLRVKRIASYASGNDAPIVKTYKYGLNGSGNGKKMFYNNLGYFMSAVDNVWNYTGMENCYYNLRTYSSVSSMQIDGYEGTPVVYPNVTEYDGVEASNNGRTHYVYDNGNPEPDNIYLLYYSANNLFHRQSNHWKRGHLTSKNIYNSAGNAVSTTLNSYQLFNAYEQNIGLMLVKKYNINGESSGQCYVNTRNMSMLPIYAFNYYPIKTGVYKLTQATEKLYDVGDFNRAIVKETRTIVDPLYLLPVESEKVVSEGVNSYEERLISYTKYPFNYIFNGIPTGTEAQGIKHLMDKSMVSVPIEQYQVKKVVNGATTTSSVINGTIVTFKPNKPYPDKIWQLETLSSIPVTTFGSGSSISSNAFVKNAAYKPKITFDQYDTEGNVLRLHKEYDLSKSYVWGYNQNYPIAEAINAKAEEVFFSSFEDGGWDGILAPQHGDKPVSAYDAAKSRAGRVSARIDNPNSAERFCHSNKVLNVSLSGPTKFKLSGWVYSNGPSVDMYLFMHVNQPTGSPYFSYVDYVRTEAINNWVYVEKQFTVPADVKYLNVRIDNNGGGTVWLDDIRLHPSSAHMISYTFDPLIGMTSQTDINNRTTSYEYDGMGRLVVIRDHDKNILKKFCYNYAGQQEACSAFTNAAINNYYYSQNCGGLTPVAYYVTVPASQFSSAVSQADADQQAQQYAQGLANQYGGCQQPNIAISGYNNTSTGFNVEFYNTNTGESFWSDLYSYRSGTIGFIPQGTYLISISPYNNTTSNYSYYVGCNYSTSGSSGASFYNVPINGSCNSISIY